MHYTCATVSHSGPSLTSRSYTSHPPKAAGKRNLRLAAYQPQPERPDGGDHSQAHHQSACIYAMPIKWSWSSLYGLKSPHILPKQEDGALPSSCLPCLPAKRSTTTNVAKKKTPSPTSLQYATQSATPARATCALRSPTMSLSAQACPVFGDSLRYAVARLGEGIGAMSEG